MRPFAYNFSDVVPPGCTQIGKILIGIEPQDYTIIDTNFWWSGPDESVGYVIAKPIENGTQPNSINRIFNNGQTASIGFNRSESKTDLSFLSLVKSVFAQEFNDATSAKNWLNENGYWTSYEAISDGFWDDNQNWNDSSFWID